MWRVEEMQFILCILFSSPVFIGPCFPFTGLAFSCSFKALQVCLEECKVAGGRARKTFEDQSI